MEIGEPGAALQQGVLTTVTASNWAFWCLATHGITQVVTVSKIARGLRSRLRRWFPGTLGAVVRCPMCFGFWAGVMLGMVALGPADGTGWPTWVRWLADGYCASAWCYAVHIVQVRLGSERL